MSTENVVLKENVTLKENVACVLRQTNYTPEQAQARLLQHNNDVLGVIREYMQPTAKAVPSKASPSVNQQIYREIRGLMDEAADTYRAKCLLPALEPAT